MTPALSAPPAPPSQPPRAPCAPWALAFTREMRASNRRSAERWSAADCEWINTRAFEMAAEDRRDV